MPRWRADHRTKRKALSAPVQLLGPRCCCHGVVAGSISVKWETCICATWARSVLGCVLHVARHYQNFLDFILVTFHVVEHHVLSNVLTVLQLVHLIICVCVEYRPTQELCQGLGEGKRRQEWNSHNICSSKTQPYDTVWYIFKETQARLSHNRHNPSNEQSCLCSQLRLAPQQSSSPAVESAQALRASMLWRLKDPLSSSGYRRLFLCVSMPGERFLSQWWQQVRNPHMKGGQGGLITSHMYLITSCVCLQLVCCPVVNSDWFFSHSLFVW